MKRLLLSIFFVCAIAAQTWAVKAWPFPFDVKQSDGTTLTVVRHGDEHFSWFATTDGVVLARQGSDFTIAAINADGTITATSILAHNKSQRGEAEQAAAQKQDRSMLNKQEESARVAALSARTKQTYASYPMDGNMSPRVLVILAQFPDMKFHETETINNVETYIGAKTIFDQFLNAEGEIDPKYGTVSQNQTSVKGYFSDMSGGTFRPQFDIYGPVTLDNGYAYYGAGDSDKMGLFVPEVCKKADAAGVDFSKYDQNDDGYVDLVYIIYAGWGQNIGGNSSNDIWPKSGTISGGTYDGKKVVLYGVNNEMNGNDPTTDEPTMMINGIGTFCHEFSHCLGLPDFYATTGAAQNANNQSMGFWDIMDMGNFAENGYKPKTYTAFEKEFFGWKDIEEFGESGNYTLKPMTDEQGVAYRFRNPKNKNEYIVVENVQEQNPRYLGHGLLAYHVEYDADIFGVLTGNNKNNTVNNTLGHPRMAVIPADGLLLNQNDPSVTNGNQVINSNKGDTFSDKSKSQVTTLTDEQQLPNFKFYTTADGSGKTNIALKNITENADGTVSFDFVADAASGISHATAPASADSPIYTLSGICVGTDFDQLPKGIYIRNNKKIVKE